MLDTALAFDDAAASHADKTSASAAASPVACALDLDKLFRQHQHHLLRFVKHYVRNPEDAEDVVQTTFMEAVRCADRFAGLSKPSTWLFGIALNLARNQVRRNCNDIHESVDDTFLNQVIDDHADPAYLIELREIAAKVEALLGAMPPNLINTFETVLNGESTYEEAAAQLSIPVGTVRSRVSRVREALRAECGSMR